jgi:hypothetical protein
MKRSALFRLALVCMAVATQNAKAGSAVVTDGHGHLITSYGQPSKRNRQGARAGDGPSTVRATVRVLAASDVTGYGAIAVARHPNGHGSIIGVALGKRSATEADTLAIEQCLKAGGTNPKIIRGFSG